MLVGSVKVKHELQAYRGVRRLGSGMKLNNGKVYLNCKGKIYRSEGHRTNQSSTGTSRKTQPAQGLPKTQPALHGSTTKTRLEHHRGTTKTPLECHRDTTRTTSKTQPGHHNTTDTTETLSKTLQGHHQDSPPNTNGTIRYYPRNTRDTTKTPPCIQPECWQET